MRVRARARVRVRVKLRVRVRVRVRARAKVRVRARKVDHREPLLRCHGELRARAAHDVRTTRARPRAIVEGGACLGVG